MRSRLLLFLVLFACSWVARGGLRFEVPGGSGDKLTLSGSDARRQLLVTLGDQDATHSVTYSAEPAGIIRVENGMVIPLANGNTKLRARSEDGSEGAIDVAVERLGS